jgi:hypothetical protein
MNEGTDWTNAGSNHRAARVSVEMRGHSIDRSVGASKISFDSNVAVKFIGRRCGPTVEVLAIAEKARTVTANMQELEPPNTSNYLPGQKPGVR